MKKLRVTYPPLTLTSKQKEEQINKLFSTAQEIIWSREPAEEFDCFTSGELIEAAQKLKIGMAPRRDGIPPEAVKVAVENIGEYILKVMNGLLVTGKFPTQWKEAKLVLVEKPRKTPLAAPSFRPLCLLDSVGKLYEQLLLKRLVQELEEGDGLAKQQYGFRRRPLHSERHSGGDLSSPAGLAHP